MNIQKLVLTNNQDLVQQEIINQFRIDKTFIVELENEPVELTECPKTGVFTVYVYPKSDGPGAIFQLSRNNGNIGSVSRMASSKGLNSETVDIRWKQDCHPEILYRPNTRTKSEFIIRIVGLSV
jgi:hypothetical protein